MTPTPNPDPEEQQRPKEDATQGRHAQVFQSVHDGGNVSLMDRSVELKQCGLKRTLQGVAV